ncbi:MAG TPA: hypothetical protein VMD04_01270 [Candidatus Margulisiibacteriota bacterium]|nr:hypothetical protein [Candidatus Margulisiibacteriota bacterium]
MRKIKLLIAKEGLIIIAIALLLYAFKTYIPSLAFPYPKYKLEFQDGSSNTIEIYPEIKTFEISGRGSSSALVARYQHPAQELISKRITQFIKASNKKSPLLNAKCVNGTQLYWYRLYFDFFFQSLLIRTLSIYLFLVLIRFILWALRTLKRED